MTKENFDSNYAPIIMPKPFADNGDKTLPANTQDDASGFSFPLGFNGDYSSPSSNNGKFVTRAQMNAIGNLATHNDFYRRCGGLNTFDPDFAKAIGGYPKGAVLLLLKNSKVFYVISLVDNNTFDFVSRGVDDVNWKYLNMDAPTDEPIVSEGYVDKVVSSIDVTSIDFLSVLNVGIFRSDYTGFVSVSSNCLKPSISSSYTTVSALNAQHYIPCGSSLFIKNIGTANNIQQSTPLPSFSGGTWNLNGFSQMNYPLTNSAYIHIRPEENSYSTPNIDYYLIQTTQLLRVNEGDYLFIATNPSVGSYQTNSGNTIVNLHPQILSGDITLRFVLG